MNKDKLVVLYSTDENYARHAATSIYTLLEKNTEFLEIAIYIISNKLSEETKNKFRTMIKEYKRKIEFIELESLYEDFEKNNDYPISSYARLFIENVIQEEKVLYIDCDTVIMDKLDGLWNEDIEEYLVGGVQDSLQSYLLEAVDINKNSRYINAGILLINLKAWRENNFKEKVYEFIKEKKGNVIHHDQGIINHICRGKIKVLEPKYNVMPEILMLDEKKVKKLYNIEEYYNDIQLEEAKKSPVIIHYISKFYNRPWFEECTHPYKDVYINALAKTGFNTELESKKLSIKVRMRKVAYEILPFNLYCKIEHQLNKKREKSIKEI